MEGIIPNFALCNLKNCEDQVPEIVLQFLGRLSPWNCVAIPGGRKPAAKNPEGVLSRLAGYTGFFSCTILCSCKIWDTLPWSIWKDCPGLVLRNSTNFSGQNRPNSRRVWSCSPSHACFAGRLGADFSNEKSGIKKIAVVTLSNIGDVILTLPVIGALRENFKDAKIDVITGPRAAEVFKYDPRIGSIYIYDRSASLASKIRLFAGLRRNRYDLLVDLRNSLFGFFVKARFCNKPVNMPAKKICHKIDEHLARIRELLPYRDSALAADRSYPIWITKDDEEMTARLLGAKGIRDEDRLITVSPGAKSHIKRWDEDGFAKVCDALIDAYKVKIAFVGDASDKEICGRITDRMRNYAVSLAGMTNLRELAWIIRRSLLIVTNDSAPLHIAGSVRTPAVAIFGPTDYRKYGPRPGLGEAVHKKLHCSPCEKALCKYNLECMKAISADEVFDAAKVILDGKREEKI